jgi:large repetitive protein
MKLHPLLFCSLFSLVLCPSAEAIVVIDDFDTYSYLNVTGPPAGPASLFSTYTTTESIGGERDVFIERTSANSGAVAMDISGSVASQLSYASAPSTSGNLLLVYDGTDGLNTLNPIGLGGVDLTQLGANTGVFLRSASDLGASITFTIYTDADHFSVVTMPIAADPSFTFTDYYTDFTSFSAAGVSGGADFTNVGAISLSLNGSTAGTDVSIETVVASVPEPGSCFLIFTAGMAVLLRRKPSRTLR